MSKIIGIAGGTACGKTTIVRRLAQALGKDAQVLSMDAYYKSYREYSLEERKKLNYDHPDAFDVKRLMEDLGALQAGKSIDMPIYDFVSYTQSGRVERRQATPIILLEGLFVLYYPELQPYLNLKVYVQADPDIRLIRRIERDQGQRGRSLQSILDQYRNTIKPMHEAFIAPTKKQADLIIPRGAENEKGIQILLEHIKKLVVKEISH